MSKRNRLRKRARYRREFPIMIRFGVANFLPPRRVLRLMSPAFAEAYQREIADKILHGGTVVMK